MTQKEQILERLEQRIDDLSKFLLSDNSLEFPNEVIIRNMIRRNAFLETLDWIKENVKDD